MKILREFRFYTVLLVCLISFVFNCSPLVAEDLEQVVEVDRKGSSAELPIDEGFEPAVGTYHYDVFLSGAKLGRASIRVDREGEEYRVAVTARTRGAMKYLYRVKYKGEALITRESLQPTVAKINEKSGNKTKSIRAEYRSEDRIAVTQSVKKGDAPEKIKTKEFQSESFILDPFSTVFLVRSLDWEVGTAEIFDLFTGSKKYELYLNCTDETELEFEGSPRTAWIIEPQTRTLTEPKEVKMSGMKVYLSKDEKKEILKIVGNPKIGRIVADLRRFDEKE